MTNTCESELPTASDTVIDECPQNLLAELDAKQNQVMADLDELNEQIECLLRQCSQERSSANSETTSKAA